MLARRILSVANEPWWMAAGVAPIAAYQPAGATSLADSYINLANPGTYDCLLNEGTLTLNNSGWVFNGGTRISTGIDTAENLTLVAKFTDANLVGTIVNIVIGFYQHPYRQYVGLATNSNMYYGYGDAAVNATYDYTQSNVIVALSAKRGYCNGEHVATAGTWNGPNNIIYIGGGITAGSFFNGTVKASAVYSVQLSDSQVLKLTSAMGSI